jgi:hypothetical protein
MSTEVTRRPQFIGRKQCSRQCASPISFFDSALQASLMQKEDAAVCCEITSDCGSHLIKKQCKTHSLAGWLQIFNKCHQGNKAAAIDACESTLTAS